MKNQIYELQKKLKETSIEFIFSGTFSQGLIEELGSALRQRLSEQQVTKSKISSVFFTFVEQTQNIKQYEMSKEDTEDFFCVAGSGIIAICKTETGYVVNSGNRILNKDIPALKKNLDMILSMDSSQLTAHFREISMQDTGNRRAGLGLIQIARKSSDKIEYNFEEVDDSCSYYTLTVIV
jgi:hypothetical protein